jgi:hypothetical protein
MRVHINGVEHKLEGPVTGARLHRIAEAQESPGLGEAMGAQPHGVDTTLSRKRPMHLVIAVPDNNTEIVPSEGQEIVSGGHVAEDNAPWLAPPAKLEPPAHPHKTRR